MYCFFFSKELSFLKSLSVIFVNFDSYKINDLTANKHPQKNKSLILTFSKSFRLFLGLFMLKLGGQKLKTYGDPCQKQKKRTGHK